MSEAERKPVARRVVIIEDDHDVADLLAILLRMMGYIVDVAYSGDEGLRTVMSCRPDVVVSDINLPGLDGWAVARKVRGEPTTAHTKLIAVTGYYGDDAEHRAKESGFDHFLVKPASPDVLIRLLAS